MTALEVYGVGLSIGETEKLLHAQGENILCLKSSADSANLVTK